MCVATLVIPKGGHQFTQSVCRSFHLMMFIPSIAYLLPFAADSRDKVRRSVVGTIS